MKRKSFAIQAQYIEEHLKSLNLPKDTILHVYEENSKDEEIEDDTTYIFNAKDTEDILHFIEKIPENMEANMRITHFSKKKTSI